MGRRRRTHDQVWAAYKTARMDVKTLREASSLTEPRVPEARRVAADQISLTLDAANEAYQVSVIRLGMYDTYLNQLEIDLVRIKNDELPPEQIDSIISTVHSMYIMLLDKIAPAEMKRSEKSIGVTYELPHVLFDDESDVYSLVKEILESLPQKEMLRLYAEFLTIPLVKQTNFGTRQLVIVLDFYIFEQSTPVSIIEDWFGEHYGDETPNLTHLWNDFEQWWRQGLERNEWYVDLASVGYKKQEKDVGHSGPY